MEFEANMKNNNKASLTNRCGLKATALAISLALPHNVLAANIDCTEVQLR